MHRFLAGLFVLCALSPIAAQKPTQDVGAGTITGNQFRSAFFKFSYEFPKGWHYLSPDKVKAENEGAYRKAVENSLKDNGPDSVTVSGNTTTTRTTEVVTPVNLLIAAPSAIATSESDATPRVRVWAHQRLPQLLNSADDHAKTLTMIAKTVLFPATEVTINGHKFVRIDVLHKDGLYHSNVMTVCGDYLVGFDFYALRKEDLRTLAETIRTVRFD